MSISDVPVPDVSPASRAPLHLPFEEVAERHEAVLFDAYGVLVDASGALPGACSTC
jgi:hypothetical protein